MVARFNCIDSYLGLISPIYLICFQLNHINDICYAFFSAIKRSRSSRENVYRLLQN